MLGFVLEKVCRLVVLGGSDRGVTGEVRIALYQHGFAAGFFHTPEERLLQFSRIQGGFQ
jgi:hypothetical protein